MRSLRSSFCVRKMIGMCPVRGLVRSARQTSYPSRSGSRMSSRIRLGSSRRLRLSASLHARRDLYQVVLIRQIQLQDIGDVAIVLDQQNSFLGHDSPGPTGVHGARLWEQGSEAILR